MQKDEFPLESRMLQKKLAEYKVVATAFFDARTQSGKGWLWIAAVLQDYQKLVRFSFEKENQFNVSLVTIDRLLFEKDVQQAFLGELVAERLILPYRSIDGHQYLKDQELRLKRRIILGSLRNLIWSSPNFQRVFN
jgi:hypothetical protein